jgi:hypothetical protein
VAGDFAQRELSSHGRSSRGDLRIVLAGPADDFAMRKLLRENPTPGAISLTFEREPDYFLGTNIAGASDETVLVYDGDALVCMGRSSTRSRTVDGEAKRVSYLGELRLDRSAHGRFGILKQGYDFFHQLHRQAPADFYFTSIAADNVRARRVLESGGRGLPAYSFLSDFVTLLIPVPRRFPSAKIRSASASASDVVQLASFLNEHAARHQLAPLWTEQQIVALVRHGLPLESFQLVREGNRLVACGALWDQRDFRQSVIRGYSPGLVRARPLVNLMHRFFGTVCLPAIGETVRQAFLSHLAIEREREEMIADLVGAFFPLAARRGVQFLTVGLPANAPQLGSLMRAFSHRVYRSRLYRVSWPETNADISLKTDSLFMPEVSLL